MGIDINKIKKVTYAFQMHVSVQNSHMCIKSKPNCPKATCDCLEQSRACKSACEKVTYTF